MAFTATQIDLSQLPAPEFLAAIDFDAEFEIMKADLVDRMPQLAAVLALESEPIVKLLQNFAYRMMVKTSAFNDETRGNLLAFAVGSQLDHIGVTYHRTARLVIQAQDLTAQPPIPEILEDDASYRARIQLAPEGFSTAGPIGAYKFHAISAAQVKDASITSPSAGQVLVAVLSHDGSGVADVGLLADVGEILGHEDVRPLTDQVIVQSAAIIDYQINAELALYEGPDSALVGEAARQAVRDYADDNHRMGHDITISGLHAALHQAGVQNVNLISPIETIIVPPTSAAYCSNISVTIGGRDE